MAQPILSEKGVEILPPHKGMGKECFDAYNEWKVGREPQKVEGVRYSIIPKDLPLTEDGRVNGAQMIREGKMMRLAEAVSQDRGIDYDGRAFRFVLPNISDKIKDQLSVNIAAISNGSLSDIVDRINKMESMNAIDTEYNIIDRKEFDKKYRHKIISINDDGLHVKMSLESIKKIYAISQNNEVGLNNDFENILKNSIFLYSQPRLTYDGRHVDGTEHTLSPNMYEFRNYISKIKTEDKREYFVRFTVQRSEDGHTTSHGTRVVDVDLIENPQTKHVSFPTVNRAIMTKFKDYDAKLQNVIDIANNKGQISNDNEYFISYLNNDGVVTDSKGNVYNEYKYTPFESKQGERFSIADKQSQLDIINNSNPIWLVDSFITTYLQTIRECVGTYTLPNFTNLTIMKRNNQS